MRALLSATAASLLTVASARGAESSATFGDDLTFLRRHVEVIELRDTAGRARVAVVPAYQARVMTSTAGGDTGRSHGWINRELIASGKIQPHINVFGGEDRFWLGPEGGQFSIFFAPGTKFEMSQWFTPASLDTEPFAVVTRSADRVLCRRDLALTNYSGTRFSLEVSREIRLLPTADTLAALGTTPPAGVSIVAYESVNTVKNTGRQPWTKSTGLLSIWILGMFNASAASTVVVPFERGSVAERGAIVNDTYFGKVPADRLVVQDSALYFRADGQHRSKIGLAPRRAKDVLGSYDAAHRTLTLVRFTFPRGATDYVNSLWELQDAPFAGDVVNSYNDDGKLGRFYELETSSPALALAAGAAATHRHQTIHLHGTIAELDAIARATLGVGLDAIQRAFTR